MRLRTALFAMYLAIAGCQSPPIDPEFRALFPKPKKVEVQQRSQEVVELPTLGYHDGPATAIYTRSQEEGEKDILHLARQGDREDAWVYLHAQEKWVDVGDGYLLPNHKTIAGEEFGETTLVTRKQGIVVNFSVIPQFAQKGDFVTSCHNHPFDIKTYEKTGSACSFGRYALECFIPSKADIGGHYHERRFLAQHGIPMLPSRIVSPLGTVSYDTTEEFSLKKLNELGACKYELFDMKKPFEERLAAYTQKMQENGVVFQVHAYHVDPSRFDRKTQ